jgi:Zn-dependent M32 family carboxypeptidase
VRLFQRKRRLIQPRTRLVETGNFLKEKFFARGGRLTLDEIMDQGTGEPMTDKYLIRALAGLNGDR